MKLNVNRYYDLTWNAEDQEGKWTSDDEGCLVLLCQEHGDLLEDAGETQWAGNGDYGHLCRCEYPGCLINNGVK
jgi:hypothetical protein